MGIAERQFDNIKKAINAIRRQERHSKNFNNCMTRYLLHTEMCDNCEFLGWLAPDVHYCPLFRLFKILR